MGISCPIDSINDENIIMQEVIYPQINQYGLECPNCNFRVGPYDDIVEAMEKVQLLNSIVEDALS